MAKLVDIFGINIIIMKGCDKFVGVSSRRGFNLFRAKRAKQPLTSKTPTMENFLRFVKIRGCLEEKKPQYSNIPEIKLRVNKGANLFFTGLLKSEIIVVGFINGSFSLVLKISFSLYVIVKPVANSKLEILSKLGELSMFSKIKSLEKKPAMNGNPHKAMFVMAKAKLKVGW